MKRVLKASCELLFIEHGCAPDPGVVAWQDWLNPLWKPIAGGCNLNRKVDELITAAGFQITELKTFDLPGPRPMTYTYQASRSSCNPRRDQGFIDPSTRYRRSDGWLKAQHFIRVALQAC